MFFMNAFEIMIELLDGNMLDDSSVFTAKWPLHAVFCNTRFIFAKHCHQSGAATKNPRLVSVSMVSHIASILDFFCFFFWGGGINHQWKFLTPVICRSLLTLLLPRAIIIRAG